MTAGSSAVHADRVIDHYLTIRAATQHDGAALRRLAAPDHRPLLGGPALLAERHGVAIAAIALTGGQVATDASITAADAVRRLRRRRCQILSEGDDVAPARPPLPRVAPAV